MKTFNQKIDTNEEPEHDTESDGECWCEPTLSYVDEETGGKVWVHKSPEELNQ